MSVNTYLTPEEKTRLEQAMVGIAGAGGLGSNVATHLVRAGVRRLVHHQEPGIPGRQG